MLIGLLAINNTNPFIPPNIPISMRRTIHLGEATGVYHQTTFHAFMNELVKKGEIHHIQLSNSRLYPRVYHFTQQGVTLTFDIEVIENERRVDSVVELYGQEKEISEVERIILAKDRELKDLSSV